MLLVPPRRAALQRLHNLSRVIIVVLPTTLLAFLSHISEQRDCTLLPQHPLFVTRLRCTHHMNCMLKSLSSLCNDENPTNNSVNYNSAPVRIFGYTPAVNARRRTHEAIPGGMHLRVAWGGGIEGKDPM